jgi:hypothetical protein
MIANVAAGSHRVWYDAQQCRSHRICLTAADRDAFAFHWPMMSVLVLLPHSYRNIGMTIKLLEDHAKFLAAIVPG